MHLRCACFHLEFLHLLLDWEQHGVVGRRHLQGFFHVLIVYDKLIHFQLMADQLTEDQSVSAQTYCKSEAPRFLSDNASPGNEVANPNVSDFSFVFLRNLSHYFTEAFSHWAVHYVNRTD